MAELADPEEIAVAPGRKPPPVGDGAEAVVEVELSPEDAAVKQKEQDDIRAHTLEVLGVTLAGSRSKAIDARASSNIEAEWLEDEEHYEGIDDANRGERRAWRGKPPGLTEQASTEREATSSTAFINITAPYVDSASAMVSDMLLPTDDRPWSIKPTPIPQLAEMAKGNFPPQLVRQAADKYPGEPALAHNALHDAVDAAVAALDEAKKKATAAQKRIEDWHVECQWHDEVRKVIEDSAKIGTGILKGPVPLKKKQVAFVDGALVLKEEIQPGSFRIDPWNFYPDGACGENIHNGSHCWEKDDITDRGLMDLMGAPGYFDDQIELVLAEGAVKATRIAPDRPLPDGITPDKSGTYEIWYFTGMLKRDDLETIGCECPGEKHIAVSVQVTMVNNRVIKAMPNTLDTGELPYDVMVWQKRAGHWAGIGISRKIRTPQEIVNGAGRNLMDNAGRAGGPQLVIKQGVVYPENGIYEVTPWKVWIAGPDSDNEHLENAFRFVTIPILQAELMAIIHLGLQLAEDATGLPMLLQGQRDPSHGPETLGGTQIRQNNGTASLRRIARTFDDRVTEPHIRRYYAYILIYGDDSEKGDFQIDARGSSALVQRDVENQAVGEMAKVVANPIYGLDPKKWAEEYLKSKHLDPKRFAFDDDKWQQIVENMAKGPQNPALAVAQLRAQADAAHDKVLQEIKSFELSAEERENARDREQEMLIAQIDAELAKAGLTTDQQKVLSEIKAKLSDTLIKVRAQAQMQAAEHGHAVQLSQPPIEPAGKAENGTAYVN